MIKGSYVFTMLKNDKTRRITPTHFIIQLLNEHKLKQAERKMQAGSAWSNDDGFIFTDELGGHLARQTVYSGFKRIVRNLGIPDTRFHDMRHSYAVAAIQAGDDMKTVQENMGHHSAAFTMDTYGHVTEKMKQESAARMEAFIQSVTAE